MFSQPKVISFPGFGTITSRPAVVARQCTGVLTEESTVG